MHNCPLDTHRLDLSSLFANERRLLMHSLRMTVCGVLLPLAVVLQRRILIVRLIQMSSCRSIASGPPNRSDCFRRRSLQSIVLRWQLVDRDHRSDVDFQELRCQQADAFEPSVARFESASLSAINKAKR
jgi:hypothetical protein